MLTKKTLADSRLVQLDRWTGLLESHVLVPWLARTFTPVLGHEEFLLNPTIFIFSGYVGESWQVF